MEVKKLLREFRRLSGYTIVAYYVLASAAALTALLLRAVLGGEFGAHYPYHTVWLAIIFASWYCGLGPSLLAIAIDSVGTWYWFLPPYHSFSGKNHVEYAGMFGFWAFAGVIAALGEANRRLFVRQQRTEQALQTANDELEERVRERTAELERSNEAARRLSAKVLAVEDEQRRKIGRSLHDSMGQYLAALKMALHLLKADSEGQRNIVSDCVELVDQCLTETRTLSHLLHPPLLDERGFCTAARVFLEGFSRRSGLTVAFDFPDTATRMPANLEIALFRALQEGLTNIHKYAEATSAKVGFAVVDKTVRLIISDNGRGVPPLLLEQIRGGTADTGVGIAGMRERIRELNGVFEIHSNSSGTTLTITASIGLTCLPERQLLTIESSFNKALT